MANRGTLNAPANDAKVFTHANELPYLVTSNLHYASQTQILIFGGIGVGKSSFLATISSQPDKVGHNSTSREYSMLVSYTVSKAFTAIPEFYSSKYHSASGHVVELINMPGFNDITRSNKDILSSIGSWLQTNIGPIAGIIYMHPITENRLTGSDRMSFNIFQAMCGAHFFSQVVLCTTMWNTLPNQTATMEATRREERLCGFPNFWAPLIAQGARYMRFAGDQASARAIIEHVLSHPTDQSMALQLELRKTNSNIEDTEAGQVIIAEARRNEDQLYQDLRKEEEELRNRKKELESRMRTLEVNHGRPGYEVNFSERDAENGPLSSQNIPPEDGDVVVVLRSAASWMVQYGLTKLGLATGYNSDRMT